MSELIASPLFDRIKNYLNKSDISKQIFIYAPYIQTKTFSKLIKDLPDKKRISVITTWHTNDLVFGSSELELYQYCKKNEISLYINNKIHLKVFSIGLESVIISTGNISYGGLDGGNEECGAILEEITSVSRLFFERIKKNATHINDEVYQRYVEGYQELMKKIPKPVVYEDMQILSQDNYFLKSALPMTRTVDELITGYKRINAGLKPSDNNELSACVYHDLANYEIELGLSEEQFLQKLKKQFFMHPFIKKIDEFIDPEAYWGRIRIWIRDHCTDVPLPRPWELTENVQTLYRWFVKLGEGKYTVDVPGVRSERIRKITP